MSLRFEYPLALLLLVLLPLALPVALRHVEPGLRRRRMGAVIVRLLLVLSAVLALASPSIVRQNNRLATIFLVDASDSVGPGGVTAARDFIRASLATMPKEDLAGVVVFGDNALVERSLSDDADLGPILSTPKTGQSDLASAVRLGLALFPEGRTRRLVLISDGQETKGDLVAAANTAAASGVEISTRTLTPPQGDEALVTEVRAPARARDGEAVDVLVTAQATRGGPAQISLFADGDLILQQQVEMKAGEPARLRFTIKQVTPGFHRFRTEIKSAADTHWQNNSASAFTEVKGKARILVLEGSPGDGINIANALQATGYAVDLLPGDRMPGTLTELVPFDAIVLVNTPAEMLATRMATLQSYVRDLGRGLTVIGGERAYGPGGYSGTPLEETLPVRMEIRNGVVNPPVSLVFAIDKSGSMAAGSSNGSAVSKIDLAKEAAYRAVKLLQPQDEVGIVAFDGSSYIVASRKPVREQTDIATRIGSLRADGGTDIRAGLQAAINEQLSSTSKVRHIVLVTDGISANNFDDLIKQMSAANITLSVIGVGQDVAPYLPQLAAAGGGRYYFAADASTLPEIFLKETRLALRSYFVEGDIGVRFAGATPITEGFDGLPNLKGYVGTTARPTAVVGLASSDGDPLLAQWQYGLGRCVAWTSDARGQWASNWIGWSEFARFWARTVGWTIASTTQDLQLNSRTEGDRTIVTVDALDPQGGFRNGLTITGSVIGPDSSRRAVTLQQIAPGRYEADLGTLTEGAHLLGIIAQGPDGTAIASANGGLIVSYSAEYRLPRVDLTGLARARELTGGHELTDPAGAFAHTLAPAQQSQAIWPLLLILAILLLPLDIAIRRLMIGKRELRAVWARAWASFRREPATGETVRTPSTPTMESLLTKHNEWQRNLYGQGTPMTPRPSSPVQQPPAAPVPGDQTAAPPVAAPVQAAPRPQPAPPAIPGSSGTLGELLKAKEASRQRGREG